MTLASHLLYGAAWLVFGLLHSLTAGAGPQRGLGRLFGRAHRLGYNALATVQLGLVLMAGAWLGRDSHPHALSPVVDALRWTIFGSGLLLGLIAIRSYRPGPFLGWAQLRGDEDDAQPAVVSGLHRYMRHPLYTAALLLLWGRVDSDLALATAVWGSLYFVIGSYFEERRLITYYGNNYRDYRAVTPRFFPRVF